MSVGATDSVAKLLQLFGGTAVMVDSLAYNTTLAACEAYGKTPVGVCGDARGMLPSALRQQTVLARRAGLVVDCVYLVPTAHNPSGVTLCDRRKRSLYAECRALGLAIIEDDAYYYLHFGANESGGNGSGELPGTRGLPRSLLSMDVDGRVLRIDTAAKVPHKLAVKLAVN